MKSGIKRDPTNPHRTRWLTCIGAKQRLTSEHVSRRDQRDHGRSRWLRSADDCGLRGIRACDPPEVGHGPLRAHQTIIIDIFPATRRRVLGRHYAARWFAVARKRWLSGCTPLWKGAGTRIWKLRSGRHGREIHEGIQQLFKQNGFTTGRRHGRMRGFFHGTGHGLGLEIHELPRVGTVDATLRAGHVVTVEPGLYYPGVGRRPARRRGRNRSARSEEHHDVPEILRI